MTQKDTPEMKQEEKLELSDFKPGEEVLYVPYHAEGNREHKDCERGWVSSINDFYVFVRFVRDAENRGFGSHACKDDQLKKSKEPL